MVHHIRNLYLKKIIVLVAVGCMLVPMSMNAQSVTGKTAIAKPKNAQVKSEQKVSPSKKTGSVATQSSVSKKVIDKMARVNGLVVPQSSVNTNTGKAYNTSTQTTTDRKSGKTGEVYLTPGGIFDTVFDGYGKKYSLDQISTDAAIRNRAWTQDIANLGGKRDLAPASVPELAFTPVVPTVITAVPTSVCSSGYFQIYVETGCGMENFDVSSPDYDPSHYDRLMVLCQVLKDISNFVESPLSGTEKVNIWVQAGEPSDPAGLGSPFFSLPFGPGVSGIADNMVWVTINSGEDAMHGVASPLITAGGGGTGSTYFHGAIKFNFSTTIPFPYYWNTNLSIPPPAGFTDLYTVALHEMMHVMGFASELVISGESVFTDGYKYYSRYDRYLTDPASTKKLIRQEDGACGGMYQWTFNTSISPAVMAPVTGSECTIDPLDATTCSTAIRYISSSLTQAVHTPDCFKYGTSLSHFEDECLASLHPFILAHPFMLSFNNQYFVMSNRGQNGPYSSSTATASMKRYPVDEERKVLIDIGYRVKSTFGEGAVVPGPNLNYHNYGGGTVGTIVGGVNDGISSAGTYIYTVTPTGNITINGGVLGSILDNDNATSFKCLEVVSDGSGYGGTLSATSGDASTSVVFTPIGGVYTILLRYVPVVQVSPTEEIEGNITYVIINVKELDGCTSLCDMVPNSGFENVKNGSISLMRDLYCWQTFSGTPDLISRCGPPGSYSYGVNETRLGSSRLNHHFVQILSARNGGYSTESISTTLSTGLETGQTYTLSFWAKLASLPGSSAMPAVYLPTRLTFGVSDLIDVAGVPTSLFFTPSFISSIGLFPISYHAGEWHNYTSTFTYTGPNNAKSFFVLPTPWDNTDVFPPLYGQLIFLDDISLKLTSSVASISLPATINLCPTLPGTIDLSSPAVLTLPTGTTAGVWEWKTLPIMSNGKPTVTNSNIFDPAAAYAASVATGENGLINVCYHYVDAGGCEQIVCSEVQITPPPFTVSVSPYPICPGGLCTITCFPAAGATGPLSYSYSGSPTMICGTPSCDMASATVSTTTTYTITELTSGCSTTATVSVNPAPPAITGPVKVCVGATITMTNLMSGTWSSSNTSVATVNSTTGVVTGVTAGTTNITFTALVCGIPSFTSTTISVNLTPITGTLGLCLGSSTTLSNTTPSGTWLCTNNGVVGIDVYTGVVEALSLGTSIITYSLDCGACSATAVITVFPVPSVLLGPESLCVGATANYTCSISGGTWSTSHPAIATIDGATGVLTGISAGDLVITYLTPGGCIGTKAITVKSTPTPITGSVPFCPYTSITLVSSPLGGTWTSSLSSIVTVDASSGIATHGGGTVGTVTVTYALSTGCIATVPVTVKTPPSSITGLTAVCTGSTITLSNTSGGGTWSSSNTSVATIDASGTVLGIAAGTTTISYIVASTSCFETIVVTVDAAPAAITGPIDICIGSTGVFFNAVPDGTWSLSDPSLATIGTVFPHSFGVFITGVSYGTLTITYTTCGGYTTYTATVGVPPITGTLTICPGRTTDLDNAVIGGTWSSSAPGIGAVVPTTGVVFGVTTGTTEITYVAPSGCRITTVVTVSNIVHTITGDLTICVGNATTLSNPFAGGTWVSSNTGVASVGITTGIVTGMSVGTVNITYEMTSSCSATAEVTVDPSVPTIGGNVPVCEGDFIVLTNATPGGTWSVTNGTGTAIIDESTGVLTGSTAGTLTATYYVSSGCMVTDEVVVNTTPAAITGAGTVCVESTTILANATPGGSWSSNNTSIATVNSAGVVSGVSAGSATITYMLGACYVTKQIVVNGLPSLISGTLSVCAGSNRVLSSIPSGGAWSSNNTTIADFGGASGVITGNTAGTTVVSYTLPTTCYRTAIFNVYPQPAVIDAAESLICGGNNTTFTNTVSGGTWASSYTGIATAGVTTGIITGVATGTATITYAFSAGCYVTRPITVDAPSITPTGPVIIDVSSTATLTGVASGGTWSPSNSNASVSTSGVVTGLSGGTVIITYTRTTTCRATKEVTVCAPYSIAIHQSAPFYAADAAIAYCPGMRLAVTGAPSGATYSWSVSPSSGIVPIPDGSGQFMFASTPAASKYVLTVIANSGGCTETASIEMVVNGGNCHPCEHFVPVTGSCTTVPYFKTITSNVLDGSNIVSGTPYYYIAEDATLATSPDVGDVFFMGYDVRLTVDDKITLDGLHFFSNPNMFCQWKGISVVNDDPVAGDLTITGNTLIEHTSDAAVQVTVAPLDAAIVPGTGSVIHSDNAIYNRNDVGMRIYNFQLPLSTTTYPFTIVNSVFTDRVFDEYVDLSAGPTPGCTDYYPFKWPTANDLKYSTDGEFMGHYNPAFAIDAYHGIPYSQHTGLAIVNSGATDDSSPEHVIDVDYDGILYHGIEVGTTADETYYNLFDTLVTGTYVANSNVKFFNNVFRHTPHGVSAGHGCGINGYQDVTLLSEKKAIELGGAENKTNNRFYNCYNGFFSSSYYTFVSRNAWVSADLIDPTENSTLVNNYGFRFVNTMYGNHIIEQNRFRNLYGSIVSVIPSCANPYGRIRIKGNEIIDLTSHASHEIGYYGIRVLDQSTCDAANAKLDILYNYVQGSSWGIEVYAQGNHISSLSTRIKYNEVHMIDNGRISAWTRLGIVCKTLANLDEITGNFIHGNPAEGVDYITYYPLPNSQGLAGYTGIDLFKVEKLGAPSNVSCNTVKDINVGFRFMHNNKVNWRDNVMQNNRYGMVLHSYYDGGSGTFFNGEIGHQGTACDAIDNIWYNGSTDVQWLSTSGVYQTFSVGADPSYSKINVRNIASGSHIYTPTVNGVSTITYPFTHPGTGYSSADILDAAAGGCSPAMGLAADCAPGVPPDVKNRESNASSNSERVTEIVNQYILTPNPTKGDLVITQKFPESEIANVKIMNVTGQIIYSGEIDFTNGTAHMMLNGTTPGIYMLMLINKTGETSSFRFVVQ